MARAKVKAGGVIRTSIDTAWRTPEWILEPVRALMGGVIPFDPFTGLDNPTRAEMYCAGVPGELFAKAKSLKCDRCSLLDKLSLSFPTDCRRCALMRKNGLNVSWREHGPFWTNPPFTKPAITKLGDEVLLGAKGVALLPTNRYEEPYLHRVLTAASLLCYVNGEAFQQNLKSKKRVAFISSIDGKPVERNPYASQLLGFGYSVEEWLYHLEPLGPCYSTARIYSPTRALAGAIQ